MATALTCAGCFYGDENHWASRKQIHQAAERCGVGNFEPTRDAGVWAAYVDEQVPDHAAKEDCIYADLQKHGLLAPRAQPRGSAAR